MVWGVSSGLEFTQIDLTEELTRTSMLTKSIKYRFQSEPKVLNIVSIGID